MKTIMYKDYVDDKLINYEYVIITKKDDYILVSEYVDFKKSGKCLITRNKEYSWDFMQVIDYFSKLGYSTKSL